MLKKIAVDQLLVGMYLQEMCGSWMDHPFWRSQFVIKNSEDIRLIGESGIKEVWIDTDKGLDVAAPEIPATPVEKVIPEVVIRKEPPKQVSLASEVKQASKLIAKSKEAVTSMFQEVRMGKVFSFEPMGALVDEISFSLMRHHSALIGLARLKTATDYTYMHSIAVCALMVAVARQMGMNENDTIEAGKAGLLHDIGKSMMPMELLNKPGKLSDDEFSIIKGHPEEGHRLLLESGDVEEIALDACLHHHEKVFGNGYPHRLAGKQISIFAKMCAICDVYDAITSNRPYKQGWDPAESISKMTEWSKSDFDEEVFQAFVKSIGIFPLGSLVRLKSGRLGVVCEQSSKSLLSPLVKVFFSTKSSAYIPPEVIDLSRPGCQEKIVGKENFATWGIKNMDELWAGPRTE